MGAAIPEPMALFLLLLGAMVAIAVVYVRGARKR